MWNPNIYTKYNQTCVESAKYILAKSAKHFSFEDQEKVLDIGCGDGGVTLNCILPELPKNFEEIIGIDKSPEMIRYAKMVHKHPKIEYLELSVPNSALNEQFSGYFNHVFLFYCLHWIPNPRDVFQNVYNVLKPGGQALMTIPISPQFDCFLDLYNDQKWRPYMHDFIKENSFPYQWHSDHVSFLKEQLNSLKFKIEFCELKNVEIVYPKIAFEEFSVLVNPFVQKIPTTYRDEFIRDYIKYLRKYPEVEYSVDKNQKARVCWKYQVLSAFVQK